MRLVLSEHTPDRALIVRILSTSGTELGTTSQPVSWGLSLYTHDGLQQMTVLLPNPLLTAEQKIAETPDWSRLALWDRLRKTYLGLEPDPVDRSVPGFHRG